MLLPNILLLISTSFQLKFWRRICTTYRWSFIYVWQLSSQSALLLEGRCINTISQQLGPCIGAQQVCSFLSKTWHSKFNSYSPRSPQRTLSFKLPWCPLILASAYQADFSFESLFCSAGSHCLELYVRRPESSTPAAASVLCQQLRPRSLCLSQAKAHVASDGMS